MRRLFKNKSKFLAGICCLCLGVASLLAGAFSFAYAPAKAEEVVDANTGFYVEQGASFRYDTEVPAIRFGVSLTKAQWEAYKAANEFTDDMTVRFDVVVGMTNRPNQGGGTSNGYRTVFRAVDVATLDAYFANAENLGKPFTVKPAIILADTWGEGETAEGKTPAELYALYAGAEFHVAGIKLTVGETELVKKDTTNFVNEDYTLRSIRSVAASLLAQGRVDSQYVEIAESFIKDANGVKAEIVKEDIKAFYDKYDNIGAKIEKPDLEGLLVDENAKVTIGSTKVNAIEYEGKILVVGNADTLVDGKSYIVNVDQGDKIYSLKGLTAATEIFYQTNSKGETGVTRLNARFAITADADTLVKTPTVETYTDEEGNTYSMTVYGVNRGYYVMGSDIDFGGTWATRSSATSDNGIRHVDLKSAAFNYSGLIGFGGTFDGNGYAIKNLRFNKDVTSTTGIFGALAYGATVKNLAIIDAHPRDYNETHRETSLIARYAGSDLTVREVGVNGKKVTKAQMEENYKYLVAKYGSTDCITIDNCYFHVNDTMIKDSRATGGITLSYPYNKGTDSIFQRHKTYSSGGNNGQYTLGSFTVTYEGYSDFVTIKNSVLNIPKDEDTLGTYNNAGTGWIGRTVSGGVLNDDFTTLENCYQIAGESSFGKKQLGFKYEHVSYNKDGTWIAQSSVLDGYERKYNNFYGYAANDYADIADGTRVYTGLDAEGKFVFVVPTEENGYTANTSVYHYQGLHRYDNYVDMSANNNASIVGFNDNWAKVGGAVIWKGLADASADKTLILALYKKVGDDYELTDDIGLGDTIKVEAFYNGEEVTSATTLSTDNASMLAISDNTFTVLQGGEATIYATAGGYTADYTIIASAVNETPVVISSNYSEVYGEVGSPYSMPYIANGNDLVATDFLTLYQNFFSDNEATVSNVYLLDANGEKTALNAVDVKDVSQYLFANAGNVKQALSIIVDGSYGYMSFADISSVTAVITDDDGFRYIPATAEGRSGYYVLGNDYDDRKNPNAAYAYGDAKLSKVIGSDPIGYSFGQIDQERLAWIKEAGISNAWMYAYEPFVGTFDGLGHTVNNLLVQKVGLLGKYYDKDQTSTLKNVIFENLRATTHSWTGDYKDDGTMVKTNGGKTAFIAQLGGYYGDTIPTLTESQQIKLENVVIRMATSQYEHATYQASETGGSIWSFFAWTAYVADDGTGKAVLKSTNTVHRQVNKVALNNTVFEYIISNSTGVNEQGSGGGVLFSGENESYSNVAWRMQYAFRQVQNTYIIAKPTSTGRTAWVAAQTASGISLAALPINDFMEIFPESERYAYTYSTLREYYATSSAGFELKTGANVRCGNLTDADGKSTFTYINNYSVTVDGVTTTYAPPEGYTFTPMSVHTTRYNFIIYTLPVNRYDDYKDMSDSGVTRVGNFAVSADGIVWSPAK